MSCSRTFFYDNSAALRLLRCVIHNRFKAGVTFLSFFPTISSPHLPRLPPCETQEKCNYRNGWNSFLHRRLREKCITSCVSLLPPHLFFSFDLIAVPNEGSLIRLSCGVESRQRASSFLSLNKMIHFSITAMSVWNELYNQQHRFVNSSHTPGKMHFLLENNMLPMCVVRNTPLTMSERTTEEKMKTHAAKNDGSFHNTMGIDMEPNRKLPDLAENQK